MHSKEIWSCRVCGLYYPEFFPWGGSGKDPSHEICDCCGIEFDYDDVTPASCRVTRKIWLEKGVMWFNTKYKSKDWNLKDQLKNVPTEYS